jgi:hypothetical protein
MTSPIGSSNNLTSDGLMSYCQDQLDSIDGEINSTMEDDQNATQVSQQLQSVIEQFQQYSNGVSNDSQTCAKLETALGNVIQLMQNTDPTNSQLGPLIQTYNNMVWSGTGGGPLPSGSTSGSGSSAAVAEYAASSSSSSTPQFIDPTDHAPDQNGPQGDNNLASGEMSSYLSTLQGASSALDSGSEMNLVTLQSLMSQRQTAISLTTNLIESLGDQTNSIASNIGH